AAVAGVVPVIRVIQESLAATEITKVFGIVNGTTNYILSEMASTGAPYGDALRRAQELGYAEADPTADVEGADAAAKMAILAPIADVLGKNEVSVRSVVQRGLGDDARLVMVMHEGPEARFFAALEEIATLDFLRAQPRAIRVIEEEFV